MSSTAVANGKLREDSIDNSIGDGPNSLNFPCNFAPSISDVCVVGAGPAGLMLATNLVRFGIKVDIIDNRPDRTATGRADGLQPKSIETLRQMRLADPLLRKGVKVYDICFWRASMSEKLHRAGREVHYPPIIDVLDPYILLVHQGMVEQTFLDDMQERGVRVKRNTAFVEFAHATGKSGALDVTCKVNVDQNKRSFSTNYLVGCDGAHSQVRKSIPGAQPIGASSDAVWGVLDGVIETDFPDLWSKAVVYSEEAGSILFIPRERNMTRLYIELKPDHRAGTTTKELSEQFVMERAQEIMDPFYLKWRTVEWFGRYQVGQRIASRFTDDSQRVFIAGDASHTHSPKAAQGMNTSMHDAWNLSWKLNLAVRRLAKPELLQTYEHERRKIAQDLINFDYEHATAFANGDSAALAENFRTNVSFISGVGANYGPNVLNIPSKIPVRGLLKPGCLLPPAKVTRYIDSNPVDVQLDIPMLGQFRIYFFTDNASSSRPFLDRISNLAQSQSTFVGRMTAAVNASYTLQPPAAAHHDEFVRPERYTPVSGLFTYALVTSMPKADIEIAELPTILRDSAWTVYMDDIPEKDTKGLSCTEKYVGPLSGNEVAVVVVRPDGYVGTLRMWPDGRNKDCGESAMRWMDEYFEGFLTT
ncbi:hypothetical protein K490DRAFT_40307 [Saccharata proteae CBS 121410]|uniref:Phenol 2-monooxygenase n=1 Tax=Saccharata proteae CBS 121410 TaxID=1314787 RepID=A0A9P4HWG8_9PEZI|nr:hypothetical protein K490DRAFT_40307 [Saccharata proteae CBS 121410]